MVYNETVQSTVQMIAAGYQSLEEFRSLSYVSENPDEARRKQQCSLASKGYSNRRQLRTNPIKEPSPPLFAPPVVVPEPPPLNLD